jgi:glucosamine--fructose-6-phosphate aminotransferase (isomerizing)
MDPDLFLDDLERKPDALGTLAEVLDRDDLWSGVDEDVDRVLLLGMGSSTFAAGVAAARLRARGIDAVADLASSDLLPPPDSRTLVVGISASGGSRETLAALQRYLGRSRVAVLTNAQDVSTVAAGADLVVPMHAGPERGGVACRTFQHSLAILLALVERLTGSGSASDVATTVRAAATASADLLDRRAHWLPVAVELLGGPDLTAVVAPARRLSSAAQSALMLREGPRRAAVGSETGEWSHVDVYLTKTLDYRMLLLPGSPWQDELLRWTRERGSRVFAVGDEVPEADYSLRYDGDHDDDVRLLSEVLVAELVAATLWQAGRREGG